MIFPSRGIPSALYENRFCNQDEFDIVSCGGRKSKHVATNEVIKLKAPEFQTSYKLTPMLKPRSFSRIAVIGSDIYVLGGYDENYEWTSSFEMYSSETKQWKSLTSFLDKNKHYSVCSFMKRIYAVGGYFGNSRYTNNCYKYEIKDNKWYQIESLQTERSHSACTVYEGKIVVTGGNSKNYTLKSVESYDHHVNKWTFLSDMIAAKSFHSAISMGNKMFVTDVGYLARSEVYDSISRKFTLFKIKELVIQTTTSCFETIRISKKLIVLADVGPRVSPELYMYNVDENKWVSENNLLKDNFIFPAYCSSFEKLPKL